MSLNAMRRRRRKNELKFAAQTPASPRKEPLDILPRGALFRYRKVYFWRDTRYPPPLRSCVPHKKRTGNEPVHPLAVRCD